MTDTWDPAQYDKFQREREQPFFDLLSLVRPGPGMVRLHVRPLVAIRNSHALLHQDQGGFTVEGSARLARVSRCRSGCATR